MIDSQECCHLLHKPDLYEAFKHALFEDVSPLSVEYIYYRQQQNLINDQRMFYPSSRSINFMQQKRYKWKINKNFSLQTAQSLKEAIIDTIVRSRLKESFKCIFKSHKFVVFTIQLTMVDSGEVGFESSSSSSSNPTTASNSNKNLNPNKPQEYKQARGSSQICTFIYLIRFVNNVKQASFETNIGNNLSKPNKQGILRM